MELATTEGPDAREAPRQLHGQPMRPVLPVEQDPQNRMHERQVRSPLPPKSFGGVTRVV